MRCHLVVLMHDFIAEISGVLVVRRNSTLVAGVLQKHDDFLGQRQLLLIGEVLVFRQQEGA